MTTRTDQVLASARKDVEAQLKLVRTEIARLAGEECTLTQALSSLDGESASAATQTRNGGRRGSSGGRATRSTRASARKASAGGRSRRASGKSTADRVEELRGLLAAGPKSRNDLASALNVSPARVQQLLAELGSSVTSQPDPNQRRGKLWSLHGRANGAGAAKSVSAGRNRTTRSGSKRGRAPKPTPK